MRYLVLFLVSILVAACAAGYPPIKPGTGEAAFTSAAPSERGSYYVWKMDGARSLAFAHTRTSCKAGNPADCREFPDVCAASLRTYVCSFAAPTAEPENCRKVKLKADSPVTVRVSGPYAGVRYEAGFCLAGQRKQSGIPAGQQWWRFPDGRADDMASGGGSPQPGATTWYVHPLGGPR